MSDFETIPAVPKPEKPKPEEKEVKKVKEIKEVKEVKEEKEVKIAKKEKEVKPKIEPVDWETEPPAEEPVFMAKAEPDEDFGAPVEKLPDGQVISPDDAPKDKKKTWIIVAIVAVVLICLCCVAAISIFLFTGVIGRSSYSSVSANLLGYLNLFM
ncbi:MAG: hypothetical protein MUO76_23120 [Anaerolineaceae bacterium]|nr:hypothetical protein [Anaerolineaceae bacterium]